MTDDPWRTHEDMRGLIIFYCEMVKAIAEKHKPNDDKYYVSAVSRLHDLLTQVLEK